MSRHGAGIWAGGPGRTARKKTHNALMGPIQIPNHSPTYRNERDSCHLKMKRKKKRCFLLLNMQLVRTAQVRVKQTIKNMRYLQWLWKCNCTYGTWVQLCKNFIDQFKSCLLEITALFISWRASAIHWHKVPGSGMRSLAVMATKHAFPT